MSSEKKLVHFTVSEEFNQARLDKILATVEGIGSRSQAARLISMGLVRKNGKVLKASYLGITGDSFDIEIPVIQTEHLIPLDFPLDIVFEDSDLIVVNKPAGLVVHPAYGHAQDTLVNALLNHTTELSLGFNEKRPGLVHRIDKGTSGLLVVAKNETSQRILAKQFQLKTTHRIYRAVVFGLLKPTEGTLRSYLRRHPENRQKVASISDPAEYEKGKLAITHYKVLKEHRVGLSLVELKLETGRTHQIRVHLSEMGHPIVGDDVYGGASRLKTLKSVSLRKHIGDMQRFALHAAELGFEHPKTKSFMKFSAPWPMDLRELVEHCDFI